MIHRLTGIALLAPSAALGAVAAPLFALAAVAAPSVALGSVSAPSVALAAGAPPVAGSPIQHVIVVVQENRSTDNLFSSSVLANGGPYPGANVAQTTIIDGKRVQLQPVAFENPGDPGHSHAQLLAEWNGGKMDGFANDPTYTYGPFPKPPPGFPIAYVPAAETTLYHLLAQRYALADENFAPRLIPTFPSHVFLITAQSQFSGNPTDDVNWGCDSKPGTTAPIFDEGENQTFPGIFPCVDDRTIGDLLDLAGVTWKYYTGAIGNLADAQINVYDAIKHIRYGLDWSRNISTPTSNVLSDIQNCQLPQVSYVTPTWLMSDHAGNMSGGGTGWVGSIYLAITQSQLAKTPGCNYYGTTAIILTWDDSGGWYDHVPPPKGPDGTTWGFRIPIVAISPWARSNYDPANPNATPYVSHTIRESTSIVRFIEKNWALGDLGQRDASGDDLSDLFDYARAQPVPAISQVAMERLIRHSNLNLAVAVRDRHAVDDDR
jgi:phospholipase C